MRLEDDHEQREITERFTALNELVHNLMPVLTRKSNILFYCHLSPEVLYI